jgi:hypothetical protein
MIILDYLEKANMAVCIGNVIGMVAFMNPYETLTTLGKTSVLRLAINKT